MRGSPYWGGYRPTPANQAPITPSNPDPTDGENGVFLDTSLSWSGGDPDGDAVIYDVYFDSENPPVTELITNYSPTTADPGALTYSQTYYWKVVAEDEHGAVTNGPIWSFSTVTVPDADGDGIPDAVEATACTDVNDSDTDDDGVPDGVEDANHNGQQDQDETAACNPDSDNDGLLDGTELGVTLADIGPDTDTGVFVADDDPNTTTNPLDDDSDGDTIPDGDEDANGNGRVDDGEANPNGYSYTVTVSAGSGGAISPAGPAVYLDAGQSLTCHVIPDVGYHIEDVTVGQVSQGVAFQHNFDSIDSDQSIAATFAQSTGFNSHGRIVFASDRGRDLYDYDIWTMDGDGSNPVQLTSESGQAMNPRWSPDGTMIAYLVYDGSSNQLVVMGADGDNRTLVTTGVSVHLLSQGAPSWFDSDTLIYTPDDLCDERLHRIDIDGTNDIEIIDPAESTLWRDYSAADDSIAYYGFNCPSTNHGIFTVDPDGSGRQNIFVTAGDVLGLQWNPSGSTLLFAFRETGDLNTARIATIDSGGNNYQLIAGIAGVHAAWSHNGTNILYSAPSTDNGPGRIEKPTSGS